MKKLLSALFGARPSARAARPRCRPSLEGLEDRNLLDANLAGLLSGLGQGGGLAGLIQSGEGFLDGVLAGNSLAPLLQNLSPTFAAPLDQFLGQVGINPLDLAGSPFVQSALPPVNTFLNGLTPFPGLGGLQTNLTNLITGLTPDLNLAFNAALNVAPQLPGPLPAILSDVSNVGLQFVANVNANPSLPLLQNLQGPLAGFGITLPDASQIDGFLASLNSGAFSPAALSGLLPAFDPALFNVTF
jgi:hypothetical protein